MWALRPGRRQHARLPAAERESARVAQLKLDLGQARAALRAALPALPVDDQELEAAQAHGSTQVLAVLSQTLPYGNFPRPKINGKWNGIVPGGEVFPAGISSVRR